MGQLASTHGLDGDRAETRAQAEQESCAAPTHGVRVNSAFLRVADLSALSCALLFVLLSFYLRQGDGSLAAFLRVRISVRNLALEVALLLTWRFFFWAAGLYQPRLSPDLKTALWRVPLSVVPGTLILVPVLLLPHRDREVFRPLLEFWFTSTGLMLLARTGFSAYEDYVRPHFRRPLTAIVCGTGPRAQGMARDLARHRDFKYTVTGFVDSDPQPECRRLAPLLGGTAQLEAVLMRQPIDEVILALPVKSRFAEIEEIVGICARMGIQTRYSLDLFHTAEVKNRALDTNSGSQVVLEMVKLDHRLYLKNMFDFVLSAVGIVLLSPVFLLISLGIKLTSRGPVFFVQQRFGLNKRRFGMIKFRSMVVDAEARLAALEHQNETGGPMFKMKRDPRVTRFGAFLRRTSLDELPQLINVLRGEMSLVGPRPLPNRDVERFSEAWLMRRFSVKPGITGLWQVSGRSDTGFEQAIELDLEYIDHWSLLLDAKILAQTLGTVVGSKGAY